jgi:hypothetical protein
MGIPFCGPFDWRSGKGGQRIGSAFMSLSQRPGADKAQALQDGLLPIGGFAALHALW